ncbi:MAG: hypothetical protein RIS70_3694 [Planctomycetota bacterium]|jgi:hypothetical protein
MLRTVRKDHGHASNPGQADVDPLRWSSRHSAGHGLLILLASSGLLDLHAKSECSLPTRIIDAAMLAFLRSISIFT